MYVGGEVCVCRVRKVCQCRMLCVSGEKGVYVGGEVCVCRVRNVCMLVGKSVCVG